MSDIFYQPVYEYEDKNATIDNNLTVGNDLICNKLKNSLNNVIYESNIIEKKPLASDGAKNDRFGNSVAISGNYAIVGAYGNDDKGNNSGSAYIFERDINDNWSQKIKLLPSDNWAAEDNFGYSVAISGNYAIVGAYRNDDDGPNSGSAYIFERDSNDDWTQTIKLLASDGAGSDSFGSSVAISGNYAIVGADFDDNKGSAYIFERDSNGNWGVSVTNQSYKTETQKLLASDGAGSDNFGSSVAISGNYAIVGAFNDDIKGSAYIFKRDSNGNWGVSVTNQSYRTETQKLLASDGADYDRFGISVAISGNYAIVGAYGDDVKGSAYIFERDNNSKWGVSVTNQSYGIETQKISASDGATDDYFGNSVAISGNYAIIGAYYNDDKGTNSGAAYIFERDSNDDWTKTKKLLASDGESYDIFGNSVAISGNYIIVGADGNDDKGNNSGAAYIFKYVKSSINVNDLTVGNNSTINNFNINGTLTTNNITIDNDNEINLSNSLPIENNLNVGTMTVNNDLTIDGDLKSNNNTLDINDSVIVNNLTVSGDINGNLSSASQEKVTHLPYLTTIGSGTNSKTTIIQGNLKCWGNLTNNSGNDKCVFNSGLEALTANRLHDIHGETKINGNLYLNGYTDANFGGGINVNGQSGGYGIIIDKNPNKTTSNYTNALNVVGGYTYLRGSSSQTISSQNLYINYKNTRVSTGWFSYTIPWIYLTDPLQGNFSLKVEKGRSLFLDSIYRSSDKRIKENITEIDDGSSLQKVRDISCVSYNYRDRKGRGNGKVVGFIAQQVKEHFDIAVTIQREVIPNELRELNITWDSSYNMTSDLQDVSGIKYKFYVSNDISGNDECEKLVVGNADGTFTFDQSWNYVFCYGKEVDDFHILDKEKLFALNFSATQEIDRIQQQYNIDISGNIINIETNKNELELLELELIELKKENIMLKSQIQTIYTRLSQLEK